MSSLTQTTEPIRAIVGGRVVTPDSVIDGGVTIAGDRIVDVGDVERVADAETVIEADGRLIVPGLIDLHGDDIERHLFPRSGARMDTDLALASADRATISAGITTKFHAIAFEMDEEDDRSPELATTITDAIADADDLLADHRLHARCEVTQQHSVDAALEVIERGGPDLVSVMSHIPGKGQFRDVEAFKQYYQVDNDRTLDEAEALIEDRSSLSMETIRERVDRVIEAAHGAGAVTASHDDENPAEIHRLNAAGVDVSEYPITLETARAAADAGMATAMGAPNLVRGESQWGNLATADAIDASVLDILVADYHPPSLLAAPFVDTGESLPRRLRRVTKAPAEAVGLSDRGRIEAGARADLLVVDPDPAPTVARAFVAGQPVYRADPTAGGDR
ncbi:alpha-D-ribose 1-methylphosphonate 5-triphosphate diphosphatase [Halorhabdus amylolytica]|uniref:alpha-D-ribose 1-methylphosphonate 5-triphosphate diphosphatase n=1 Tax=Halorhabdus amylolytica TaxID=2559573 RepID=UPI0010AB1424|nr:alpha-D-ribose 1-methylphosphonate 5-triphosphate diphosphatase [Halorhabdus amylolytica]